MKIISGEKKGYKIYGPGPEKIRPMRHSVRKAFFDILQNVIEGSNFLDLFAGTGSVGLEALSQGANHATFVDSLSKSGELIGKSIDKLGYQDVTTLEIMEVSAAIEKYARRDRRFDIVFLGPPYERGLSKKTLNQLKETNLVRRWGILGVEIFFKTDLSQEYGKLKKIDSREYGQSKLVIYRHKPENEN